MDPKTKSKPGCPKRTVNNTENKDPENNSSLGRVVQDDKDS